jgi:5-methylcytosine-specific restriction endonuclease McrA/ABC-type dipeptide/oligopeptide/nickel transport system ATPase subunit
MYTNIYNKKMSNKKTFENYSFKNKVGISQSKKKQISAVKMLEIGQYKLNYNIYYKMSYYEPFSKKWVTLTEVLAVKNEKVNLDAARNLKSFLLKKAHLQLDILMAGFKHLKYSLTKVAQVRIIKLIQQQVWDVSITIRFHYEWDIEGVIKHGASQVMTFREPIKAQKITNEIVYKAVKLQIERMRTAYYWAVLEEIISWKVIGHTTIKKNANFVIANEFMMEATPIKYSWIPDVKFSSNSMCVYNALGSLTRLPLWFKTPSKLLAKFQEYEDERSALDFGLECCKPTQLTLTSGVAPWMIQKLCVECDITHYCLDIQEKTLLKNITKQRHYSSICYVTHDNHMYLITDKKFLNRLAKSRSTSGEIIVGMLRDRLGEDKEVELTNIVETWSIDTLHELKDCTIIDANASSLHETLIDLYKREKTIYVHRSKNDKITSIKYANNVTILIDPNHSLNLRDKEGKAITWKTVQKVCKLKNIPFMNQSFPSLAMQIVNDVLTPPRITFTKAQKLMIVERQESKCNICNLALKKIEYDHIVPLASGGNNDLDNIQALCVECHFEKSKSETDNGEYCTLSPHTSTFNATTRDIFMSDLMKRYAFIERIAKIPDGRTAFYIDINKCRRNILLHLNQNGYVLPVFTCMDEPEKFNLNDTIAPGFYFIETDLYFPCRGNGWYSYALIEYCLKNNLITKSNIKYKIHCGLELEGDYFTKALKALIALPDGLDKVGPNIIAGLFNKTHVTSDRLFFTNNFSYASTKYMETQNNDMFIQEVDTDSHLYEVRTSTQHQLDLVNNAIYHLILDIEAVELHTMKTRIEQAGGHVTYLNTDCCECWFDDNTVMKIDQYFWDDAKKLQKYKYECRVAPPTVEAMKKFKRDETYSFTKPAWKVVPDPQGKTFKEFAQEIINLGSFNLDGRAGTGKTTMARTIVSVLDDMDKKYVLLAPTNKAARQLSKEAMTIHKFVAKSFGDMKTLKRQIEKLDYIIVDEVSMVKEIFFKVFTTMKMVKPSLNFIIGGDIRQIPPPCDRVTFEYKDALVFHELCGSNRVEMTECRRSDKELFNLSFDVDHIDLSNFGNKIYNLSIAFTNKKRIEINNEYMKRYAAVAKWTLEVQKLSWDKNSQDMQLYEGLPLIARINARNYNIANNETFKIVGKTDNDHIKVSDGESYKTIPLNDIPKYFHPAYCLTVHRSQGSTFNQNFTIFEWAKMTTRLRYTALTRATKKEFVNIIL